uniref:Cyclic nucleotide-binding domain-containing protein n=1 Tax=Anopheles quadriannulatus TaxID=34691 RepID=A0A182XED4_ANOQN
MSDPLGNTGQSTVRLSYEQLRDTLGRFAYFRHWTEDQIRECSVLARVVQYAPQQTIPLELPLPFAYLVLSGQCMMLQCLPLVRGTLRLASPAGDRDQPTPPAAMGPPAPDEQLETVRHLHETFTAGAATSPPTGTLRHDPANATCFLTTPTQDAPIVHQFVDVGTLRCGAVFGLGERHQQRTVVARTRTQCLLLPRCWLFLKRQNVGNTWQRLRLYLDGAIPGRDELYRRYLRDQAWLDYRRRLLAGGTAKRCTGTTPADVPMMCRMLEPVCKGKRY